jgi:GT2 family glycosyltransferase
VNGFVEQLASGEDTDLSERARATGAAYVGAADAIVYHAVESSTLLGAVRRTSRWQHLAFVVKQHPHVRERLVLGVFWRRSHLLMALAVAGVVSGRRPVAVLLTLPYAHEQLGRRGTHVRGRLRAAVELPGRAAVDIAEMAVLARGSVRYRTLFL